MANKIIVGIEAKTGKFESDVKTAFDKGAASATRFKTAISQNESAVRAVRSELGRLTASIGGAFAIRQIAQFGIALDRARNTMAALTGSVAAANVKMAELRELARSSPGVTQGFAVDLFNRLKAVGGITDEVINKTIKSLGKLSTVFADVGPEFSRNLIQIFSTSFERDDIKQALNAVPIFEQLLESAFGTKDPAKLRKLKEAGKLTLGGFLSGFDDAINRDPRFKNIQDSLGGKLAKSFDESKQRLAELGEKALTKLLPVLEKLLPVANKLLDIFTSLPIGLQAATIAFIAMPGPISAVAGAIKGLTASLLGLGAAGANPGFAKVVAFLGTPIGAFGAVAGATGLALFLSQREFEQRTQAAEFTRNLKTTPLDLEGKPLFQTGLPAVGDLRDFRGRVGALNPLNVFGGATPPPIPPPGGGTGGRRSRIDPAIEKIKELQKQIAEARAQTFELVIDDLTGLLETIRTGSIETELRQKELAGRPAQLAGFSAANAERIRQINLESLELEKRTAEAAFEAMKKIEPVLSASESFMLGFKDATIQVSDAFSDLGANIAASFTNIRTLFDSLKRSVLQFFNDILGASLQNLVRSVLGPIFGGGGGGGIGNIFRSFTGGGNGLAAPPSVSIPGLSNLFTGRSSSSGPLSLDSVTAKQLGGGGGVGSFFGGIGRSFAAAAPLLGLTLGASLGGQSTAGKILGGIGGALGGSASSLLGLGSALGIAGLVAAPFFLLGSFFLGKAKQRGKDEEAAGQMLLQAQEQIRQLKAGIANDSIDGSQARAIFESEILTNFRNQIGTLKTGSVRRSRLSNQVNDLRKLYDALIPMEITAQLQRRQNEITHSKLVPEFATGGIVPGRDRGFDSVRALLRPGEMVLNMAQQANIARMAGPQVFQSAGVPGVQQNATFQSGGVVGSRSDEPIVIYFDPSFVIGKDDQTKIFLNGGMTSMGRRVVVKQIEIAQRKREL